MTRNEIITFAKELARGLQNNDTLDVFMNETFRVMARKPEPPLVKSIIKLLNSGISTYAYEAKMLKVIYAIMNDELLTIDMDTELDAYSATQESDIGTPTQLTENSITARKYRLYPTPDFDSVFVPPVHGEPYGEDFDENPLVLFFADDREAGIPDIFAIPFAFDALAREFAYPSDHEDKAFAFSAFNVSQLFNRLLGIGG